MPTPAFSVKQAPGKLKRIGDAERSNQACVQYRARCRALPKARLEPEGERAAEMTAAGKVRFWTANPGVYEAAALCAEQ